MKLQLIIEENLSNYILLSLRMGRVMFTLAISAEH